MAKRKYEITEKKINRYIKEGRGIGSKEKYKPWITIQDMSSNGRSNRIKGWKTGRVHHFMSDLEAKYFYLLEWSDSVVDIREQYPLIDRKLAIDISEEKNIKYPMDTRSQTSIVLTTDFMITIIKDGKEKKIARTLKYSKELEKKRVIEKFEIEREYWDRKGIDWGVVTENSIPAIKVKNIMWIHKSYNLDDIVDIEEDLDKLRLRNCLEELLYEINSEVNSNKSLLELTNRLDYDKNVKDGTFLYLFKYATLNKMINVDITKDLTKNILIKNILK